MAAASKNKLKYLKNENLEWGEFRGSETKDLTGITDNKTHE